jgi:hypothetical protein
MCICDADSGGEPQTRVFRVFAKDSIQRLNDAEPPPQALTDAEKNGENRYQEINAFYGLADCIRGALDERPDEDWGGAQWSTGEFRTYAEFEMSVTCRGSEADEPTIRQITSDGGDELWKFVQGSVDLLQVAIDRDGSEWSVDYVLSGQPAEVIENFGLGCPAMSDVMPRDNKSIFHHGQLTVGCEGGVPKVDLDIVGSDSSDFPTHNAWLFEVDGDDRDLVDFVREPQNDFRDLWSLPDVPELD